MYINIHRIIDISHNLIRVLLLQRSEQDANNEASWLSFGIFFPEEFKAKYSQIISMKKASK